MYRVSPHVRRFAVALLLGAALATLWVNLAPDLYFDVMEYRPRLPDLLPGNLGSAAPVLTLQSFSAHGLMALFIAFVAKELWEALVLERGALAGAMKRALPTGLVIGGVFATVLVWLIVVPPDPDMEEIGRIAGWPIPVGSDVVLSYVFGAWVFGKGHPALHLLLLIAIAFDILGLFALGIGAAEAVVHPLWLVMSALALGLVWLFSARHARPGASERLHRRAAALWPYLLAGLVCWAGVVLSGLPGALGLLPLVPVIPHAERSFGLFAEAEAYLHDPLNRMAQAMVDALPPILFLFGLTHGGVALEAFGPMTLRVLAALWLGKPLGILLGAGVVLAWRKGALPPGVKVTDLILIAILSGIGAVVPFLSLDTALPGGIETEAARAGIALSLGFGPLAFLLSRVLRRGTMPKA